MEIFNTTIPNRRILFSAKSFRDSALAIERSGSNEVPQIVCLSFSIELYLKCLNSKTVCDSKHVEELEHGVKYYKKLAERPGQFGHDLESLFNALSQEHQTGISECWNELGFKDEYGGEIFLFIKEYKDLFKDWRYAFEEKIRPVNLTLLNAIAHCFDTYTEKIKKLANQ